MRLAILGAGGFAREVAWLADEVSLHLAQVEDPGYTDIALLDATDEAQLEAFDGAVIGVGDPALRLNIAESVSKRFPKLRFPSLIHPTFHAHMKSLHLEEGVLICAGVIATVEVHIEAFAMVNLACTIGHGAVIGRGSVLNPTVNVSGGVTLGRGCLIGTGAQIIQGLSIGDGARVGAGAVVTKNVPAGVTAKGIPARWD